MNVEFVELWTCEHIWTCRIIVNCKCQTCWAVNVELVKQRKLWTLNLLNSKLSTSNSFMSNNCEFVSMYVHSSIKICDIYIVSTYIACEIYKTDRILAMLARRGDFGSLCRALDSFSCPFASSFLSSFTERDPWTVLRDAFQLLERARRNVRGQSEFGSLSFVIPKMRTLSPRSSRFRACYVARRLSRGDWNPPFFTRTANKDRTIALSCKYIHPIN